MSKEYLDELNRLGAIRKFDGGDNYSLSDKKEFKTVKKALQRLEAIDNASPSKALKCLDKIISSFNETTTGMNGLGEVVVGNELIYFHKKELEVIEDALRQAREDKMELEKYRR